MRKIFGSHKRGELGHGPGVKAGAWLYFVFVEEHARLSRFRQSEDAVGSHLAVHRPSTKRDANTSACFGVDEPRVEWNLYGFHGKWMQERESNPHFEVMGLTNYHYSTLLKLLGMDLATHSAAPATLIVVGLARPIRDAFLRSVDGILLRMPANTHDDLGGIHKK